MGLMSVRQRITTRRRRRAMPSATPSRFTTFASCRFIDHVAVRQELQDAAVRLKRAHPAVVSITLFGSFAAGVPTPRSDADILVEVEASLTPAQRREAAGSYVNLFQDVSVPVELFVCSSAERAAGIEAGYGIASTASRTGLRLA